MTKSSLEEILERNLCEIAEASGSIERQSTYQRFLLKSLGETITLGKALNFLLPNLNLLFLEGPLGAGKTSLVKGLAKGLNIKEPITSPTFPLAQHYLGGDRPLIHLDLYRLDIPNAADELFIEEEEQANAQGALIVVEWPNRLGIDIPEAWRMKFLLRSNSEERIVEIYSPKDSAKNSFTSSSLG